MPEVTVTIGTEDDERGVTVAISDDNGWTPDVISDACNRAVTAACTAWLTLHPEPAPTG